MNSESPKLIRLRELKSSFVAFALFAILLVPFIAKPVHIDDANFLILSEGAARDPWRPHLISINWLGTTEPAFDVLSNPPGIAWWLAPFRKAPEWGLHLWMSLWLVPAIWGCARLGRVFVGDTGYSTALFLMTCPVVVLSAQSLTPDLPLFACVVAGMGGFLTVSRHRWAWALLGGTAFLFRYSGGFMIPLLMLAGWRQARWRGLFAGSVSALPAMALILHDLHAYHEIHLLAMLFFQNDPEHKSRMDALHNLVAAVAMLGGAGVLPVLIWRKGTAVGAFVGAWVGANVAYLSGQSLAHAIPTVLFTSMGAAALSLAFARQVNDRLLVFWTAFGCLLFLVSRFPATRYWIPFVPAIALLALRNQLCGFKASGRNKLTGSRSHQTLAGPAKTKLWRVRLREICTCRSPKSIDPARESHDLVEANTASVPNDRARRVVAFGIVVNVLVSLGLAIDDQEFARAQRDAAIRVSRLGTGTFSGHWGWQHYLLAAGWQPVEENGKPGELHASSRAAAPQRPDWTVCLDVVEQYSMPDRWWGPRVHSGVGGAWYHAGGERAYAPWTFADDSYDDIIVYRRCSPPSSSRRQRD